MIGMIMFGVVLLMLMLGFFVVFIFGGVVLFFGIFVEGMDFFVFMFYCIMSVMQNIVLMVVFLFIFMGVVFQCIWLVEQLLIFMGWLFGGLFGGLVILMILVGVFLVVFIGVVGVSVVVMGLILLFVMLVYKYDKWLVIGIICVFGIFGQIVLFLIIFIILGDVFGFLVGDLFKVVVWFGIVLVGLYIVYILVLIRLKFEIVLVMLDELGVFCKKEIFNVLLVIILLLVLIVVVLGLIFIGIVMLIELFVFGGVGVVVLVIIYW